jgi:NADPH-dependent 2,4-dienoyl-CoA reductase/sulfur reductase-like enzyme
VDKGILVDQYMRASHADIFAAGDVAQVYDPLSGKSVVDSLWGPARDQGSAAGLNMVGITTPYSRLAPFNVTRLAHLTTTIIGTVNKGRDEDLLGIARGDSETWRNLPDAIAAQANFDVNSLRLLLGKQQMLGAVVMGDQTLSRPLTRIVIERVDITPIREQILQPGASLGDLVADFWSHLHNS